MAANRAATTTDSKNKRGPGKENNNRLYRFRRANRLPDAAAYGRVFRGGGKSRDEFFIVLSKANGTDCARLGLAISKKHCRKASGRNRLKRIVRESFRAIQPELGGVDVVVLGRPGASRADNAALFESLARHWQRILSSGKPNG